MAHVYATVGMTDPIAELRNTALQAIRQPMGEFVVSSVWTELGWSRLRSGDDAGAIEDFDTGLGGSSITQYLERPRMLVGRAAARRRLGDLEAATRDVAEAHDFVVRYGVALADPAIALERAAIAAERGDGTAAVELAGEAHRLALGQGRRLDVVEALLLRARAEALMSESDAARRSLASARETLTLLAGAIVDEPLRDGFLAEWGGRVAAVLP